MVFGGDDETVEDDLSEEGLGSDIVRIIGEEESQEKRKRKNKLRTKLNLKRGAARPGR